MLYHAQSDTTVGFLSRDAACINLAKGRDASQEVLQTVASFKDLKTLSRIPKKHRNFVRRASKSTFILANKKSARVVSTSSKHHSLVHRFGAIYSSSANTTRKNFNEEEAFHKSDIIVKDSRGFFEDEASKLYKLSNSKIQRIR